MIKAKTRGQGDKTVHTYRESKTYPTLLKRLCAPDGRLWEPGALRIQPLQPYGWSRVCPDCQHLEAELATHT